MPSLSLLLADAPAHIETLKLPLVMLLVFGSAKLFAEIFEWLQLPGIVGEIAAGVILGPSLLAWVSPDGILTSLSELGVMFLLFRAGLEVKSSELLKVGGTATFVAACGVIVPFGMAFALMTFWGSSKIEAIFVGACLVATSVGITAQVLGARGLLNLRASQIILAAAVIDETRAELERLLRERPCDVSDGSELPCEPAD